MERIEGFLKERKRNNLLRTLRPASLRQNGIVRINGRDFIDFSSNDYLGLSGHPHIKEASKNAIDGFAASSSASRLLSGDLDIFHQLEERVAVFKGKEAGLVFNSGYQANVGIISALCSKGDVIFSDKLNHASIIDGILLSGARFFRFNHNNVAHLESLLKKNRSEFKRALIVTETVFSMDGDKAYLKEIVDLKTKYKSMLMVDEAHATGIFGESGAGVVDEQGLCEGVDLIMGTFSKGLGSFGAYLACPKKIKEYLINTCRGFIYSTGLPPAIIAADLASLDLVRDEAFRRIQVIENADYFRGELQKHNFQILGETQIIPLILGDSQTTVQVSKKLQDQGYWVLPIRPPTVPEGKSRLRFSLTFYHTRDMLDKLINDLLEIREHCKI